MHTAPREDDLPLLRAPARTFPTIDAAEAEIAHLRGVLCLPKGTEHVVSDVHGEHKKLQHIINNASGSLRPLLDQVFGDRLCASTRDAVCRRPTLDHAGWSRSLPISQADSGAQVPAPDGPRGRRPRLPTLATGPLLDTTLVGNHNTGHADCTAYTDSDRADLLRTL